MNFLKEILLVCVKCISLFCIVVIVLQIYTQKHTKQIKSTQKHNFCLLKFVYISL